MKHFRQGRLWLALIVPASVFISSAAAQNATNLVPRDNPASIPAAIMPPPPSPVVSSPMDYFRRLLALSPEQREAVLARKSPQVRARFLAKINEYMALDPNERALRLRATDLRWFLMPLLRASPDQREAQLATIPQSIRELVQSRLMEWEILPPPLQQEFFENEHILGYFSGVEVANNTNGAAPSDAEQSHWNALSDVQRQAMTSQFNDFFELSSAEKQEALGELSDAERRQMEKTLQTFDKLPPLQRAQCVKAFGKFASMNRQERVEFLQNATRWSKMTASERQAWRDLVAHVPQWPPLPPAMIMPPIPPTTPATQNFRVVADTNHG